VVAPGSDAPKSWTVRENGVRFEIRLDAGSSAGLFLDQRDNRRRLMENHVAAGFEVRAGGLTGARVLNSFAYTCGFSVCAALAGGRTTSIDLSRGYLDWGRSNFRLNGLDPEIHEFLVGDALDWLRRLARRQRRFDVVILDPPTFSRNRQGKVFRAEQDYGALLASALAVLESGGVVLASTNAQTIRPDAFLEVLHRSVAAAGRRIHQERFAPQPPDFPITRAEPAHLKTVWMRVV
jgi:23S rRNA (cytosine1962-C5)-methyltransferase